MEYLKIDGRLFAQMIRAGANNLTRNVKTVDALNVFPVPDGDTGTNMNLSFTSGVNEMNKKDSTDITEVTKALSKGLLMGARGNSGVILSQLFRGFSKSIEGHKEIDTKQFAAALQHGVDTAYKAVMKPVEGTILTVSKDAAKVALKISQKKDNVTDLMDEVLREASASLKRTPDLLPILKQVGVVDSGGQGLVHVYEGMLSVLKGESISDSLQTDSSLHENYEISVNKEEHVRDEVAAMMASGVLSVEDIKYGYCTEFMIRLDKGKATHFNEILFRENINNYGDSLLVISDEELVKVHIHAEELNKVMELAQQYGGLMNIKIENMREQFLAIKDTTVVEEKPLKSYGVITVTMGEGIANIFRSLGADYVISGGQTMNPSTEDFVKAIKEVHAENIIILPNNSNIILAAEQSADLVEENVAVIPTKTVPQGMSAMLSFNPSTTLDQNKSSMISAKDHVKSGQVTFAVRDTEIDDVSINKGDFMGIFDGKIVHSSSDLNSTAISLLEKMIDEESEIVTLIYGADVIEKQVESLEEYISAQFPDVEIEFHNGEQPLYSYLISVE